MADEISVDTNQPDQPDAPSGEPTRIEVTDSDFDGAEPDPASEAAKTLQAKKRSLEGRKSSIQAQINDLVKQRGETQRERDAIRDELQALRAERDALKSTAPARREGEDPEPKEDEFESYGAYVKAQARWEARQEFQEQTAKARTAHQRAEATRADTVRRADFAKRLAAAREKHAEFDARVDSDLRLNLPMQDVIVASPLGPEIMLYLAEHEDEAEQIYRSPDLLSAFGEMKKLEARLEAVSAGPAQAKTLSHAKPPIKPVARSLRTTGPETEADDDDVDAFIERENAKDRRNRRH
jgi:hypothetical protein